MSDFITKPAFFASFSLRLRKALLSQDVDADETQEAQDWFEANHLLAVYGVKQPLAMLDSMAEGSPSRAWAYDDDGPVAECVDALLHPEDGEKVATQASARATCIELWLDAGLDEDKLSFEPRERGERASRGRRNRFARRAARS